MAVLPRTALTLALLLLTAAAWGKGVYQTREAFLREVFGGGIPAPRLLWLDKTTKETLNQILQHPYTGLRLRYWGANRRSAWILEEVGKELPITVGVAVDTGRLERIKILAFWESRGGEVRYPFFTDQFQGAVLTKKNRLDRAVDGISGATLSVRAVTKLARIALYLHQLTPYGRNNP